MNGIKNIIRVIVVWLALSVQAMAQHNFKLELVKNINIFGDSHPSNFYSINESIIFLANDGIHGRELWTTDGTPQGTHMVKDIHPTGDGITFRLYKANGNFFYRR